MFHGIVTGKVAAPPESMDGGQGDRDEVKVLRKVYRGGRSYEETVYIDVPKARQKFLEQAYDKNWSVVFVVHDVVAHVMPSGGKSGTPVLYFRAGSCDLA